MRFQGSPPPLSAGALVAGFFVFAQAAAAQGADSQDALRREQERESQRRSRLEPDPAVRLQAPPALVLERLAVHEQPCFAIHRIHIEGAGALAPPAWLQRHLAGPAGDDPPQGRCLGSAGVDLLLRRLQNALVARGLVTTRVFAPAQALDAGELRLQVVPGRLRRLHGAMPRAGVSPPLREGQVVDLRTIEQALEALQRVPTAQVAIRIEPAPPGGQGEEGGEGGEGGDRAADTPAGWSDLVIDWAQPRRWRVGATLDDSGNRATGRHQASATLSLDNPLGNNDLLYLTLAGSPGSGSDRRNEAQTLHYGAPWGWWLFSATASASRYLQTVAGASQRYAFTGDSRNAQARAARMLYRDATLRTTGWLQAFARGSASFIDDTEVQVQRRRVGGWEAGLQQRATWARAQAQGQLSWRRGTGAFGSQPAPEEATDEGRARMALWLADAQFSAPWQAGSLGGQVLTQWRAQWNRTPLTPQDRFAIGGRWTVRGFDGEQVLQGERGWLLRHELGLALSPGQQAFLALDHGEVGGASTAALAGTRLTGMALGWRAGVGGVQLELFAGRPLRKPAALSTPDTTAGFSLAWSH